jgi:hypothetical protein
MPDKTKESISALNIKVEIAIKLGLSLVRSFNLKCKNRNLTRSVNQ